MRGFFFATFSLSTILLAFGQRSQIAERERFRRPEVIGGAHDRKFAQLAWVTTDWISKSDVPFEAITREYASYAVFRGFDMSGLWKSRVTSAYRAWFEDCQNPEKLFKLTLCFGIMKEQDNEAARSETFQSMWTNVRHGWHIFRGNPRSRLFVRQGYRALAGDQDRHLFGDIAVKLLKVNPNDRVAFAAGVAELWDERPQWDPKLKKTVQLPQKGEKFENMLIEAGNRVRKTEQWRPWDEGFFAQLYAARGVRTRKVSDLDIAVGYAQRAIDACPKEFSRKGYEDFKSTIVEMRRILISRQGSLAPLSRK